MTKTDFGYIEEWHNACQIPNPEEPTIIHEDQGVLMFKLMYEELIEFKNALKDYDSTKTQKLAEITDALLDIRYLLDGTIRQYGLHKIFDEGLQLVHKSNMTKTVGGKLLKREDGKILKPESYVPVNLLPLFSEIKKAA